MLLGESFRGLFGAGHLLVALLLPASAPAFAEDAATRLARLETVLDREEGVRAVKRLQAAYGQNLEEGRWSELRPLFTNSATARFEARPLVGREAIVRYLKEDGGGGSSGLPRGHLNTREAR